MILRKFKKIALVSTMVLSIGTVSLLSHSTEASAKTVVSQTTNKSIILFSKDDLKKATNVDLSMNTIDSMYSSLVQERTWTTLGYSTSDAQKIAQRFSLSSYQAKGILSDIVKSGNLELKVIVIKNPYYSNVNIGAQKVTNVILPEDNPTTEPGTTSPEDDNNGSETETTTPENSILDGIKEIEIDIEYKKKDIELDLDVKSDGRIKAEVENEFTNQKFKDDDAKEIILDVIAGLDIKNSSEETIKNHVISKLNAGSDYKKFEFKVKYFDGSKVEFKLK